VGVTAALLLAKQGVAVTVLEAAPFFDPAKSGSKAICQQRDVLDILDRIGVAGPMLAEAVTWTRGRTFYRAREIATTEFEDPGESPTPPWVNISQCSTERYLLERAAKEPLVSLRYGERVVGIRTEGEQVLLELERPSGARSSLTARWVLGADGSHSSVRRLVGVGFPGESYDDQFLIVDIRADLPFPNERHFHFDPPWNPGRQVLIHQCPDRVWRIDWQVPSDYDLEAERRTGALDERIRRVVGRTTPYEVVWLSVYRFHERVAERFREGRVFLLGDAAHIVAPFGARGLNSGIQDAENLAWKLALVEHGVVHEDAAERLLDSYDAERRAAALENVAITSETMRFLVPRSEADWRRRVEILEAAARDPAAASAVNSGRFAEPYPYAASPLTTTSAAAPGAEAPEGTPRVGLEPGSLFPDAPCRVEGRPEVRRVRDLFGVGFVALAPDAATRAAVEGELEDAVRLLPGLPVRSYDAEAITAPARKRTLADLVRDGRPRVFVIRPDGHVAAALDAASFPRGSVVRALARACGLDASVVDRTTPGTTS
jgi:2-polyprenyl-6-methoxyphenol hydroxylase-like FAD-dependent oxidoreductase